jgi:hypothetical protein
MELLKRHYQPHLKGKTPLETENPGEEPVLAN